MNLTFKIIVVGNGSVGKTSLVNRFAEKKFSHQYIVTLGVNITVKNVKIQDEDKEINVRLQIWDIAGQEKWNKMKNYYYQGSQGTLLVYDCTRIKTFQDIKWWMEDIKSHLPEQEIPQLLLSNKCDLTEMIRVSKEQGKEFNKQNDLQGYYCTSALTGISVNDAFKDIAREIYNRDILKQ